MKILKERIQHIAFDSSKKILFACGRRGGVYRLGTDLQIECESQKVSENRPMSKVVISEDGVFTRDVDGCITAWDKQTLMPRCVLVSSQIDNSFEIQNSTDWIATEALPSVSHGLHLWKESLFAVSGTGDLLELEPKNLSIKQVFDFDQGSYIETIETSHSQDHVFSDFSGWLWKGNLASGQFKRWVRVDSGPCHCVVFDSKHDRYWATTDNCGGFSLVNRVSAELEHVKMTNDDVEWIAFDNTCSRAYIACFDHYLYIYENALKPKLLKKIGPFKFQLKQVVPISFEETCVLLESGELFILNDSGNVISKASFEGNCIWSLQKSRVSENTFFAGFEDGTVRTFKLETSPGDTLPVVQEESIFKFPWGRVRRVKSLSNGNFIGISSQGLVFCGGGNGKTLWATQLSGICRDLSIDAAENTVAVGTENNVLVELDTSSGKVTNTFIVEEPIWAVCYDNMGRIIAAARRKEIFVFNRDEKSAVRIIAVPENIKGVQISEEGTLLANGAGFVAEYSLDTFEQLRFWDEGFTTTCEAALLQPEFLHVVGYDLSLSTFSLSDGSLIDRQLSLSDFPKAIASFKSNSGESIVAISGRGPYISLFHNRSGKLEKFYDFFPGAAGERLC